MSTHPGVLMKTPNCERDSILGQTVPIQKPSEAPLDGVCVTPLCCTGRQSNEDIVPSACAAGGRLNRHLTGLPEENILVR